MTFIQAMILGWVQGITEFFPISSSAHLKLARSLMGVHESTTFDLVCHSGTLIALICFLWKDVWETLRDIKKIALYTLALCPLVPGYFLMKPLREILSQPQYLGYAWMVTGILLFAASKKIDKAARKKWQHVVCIGMMQTMALVPGISRSGSTIAAARFCGWDWREAVKFSFLLSIPTILGGEILEILKQSEGREIPLSCYLGGFFASLSLGLIAIRFVFWIYETEKVRPFAWYCLGIGLLARLVLHG